MQGGRCLKTFNPSTVPELHENIAQWIFAFFALGDHVMRHAQITPAVSDPFERLRGGAAAGGTGDGHPLQQTTSERVTPQDEIEVTEGDDDSPAVPGAREEDDDEEEEAILREGRRTAAARAKLGPFVALALLAGAGLSIRTRQRRHNAKPIPRSL